MVGKLSSHRLCARIEADLSKRNQLRNIFSWFFSDLHCGCHPKKLKR